MFRIGRLFVWGLMLSVAVAPAAAYDWTGQDLPESGAARPELEAFDHLMRSFLRENEIPGAALAVAKDGRIVYARGFGYADPARRRPVEPDALFRVASLSKPITALTILRWVDQGKLSLDDPVLRYLAMEPLLSNDASPDPRWEQITIRHLLQHTGGWDHAASGDPMFRSLETARRFGTPPPATAEQIVRLMRGQPLDFDPGTRYAYSNFGYCLLGRVIEHIGGRSYEECVREALLEPLDIHSMRLGRTLRADRVEGEVSYVSEKRGISVFAENGQASVPRPYGTWCLETMDAHGGWIASAPDLARLAAALDDNATTQLLSSASLAALRTPPIGAPGHEEDGLAKTVFYGLGFQVRRVGAASDPVPVNRWHTGSLDGTSSLLVLRHDHLCWAVLFNTRDLPDGKEPAAKIDPLLHEAAAAVRSWPATTARDASR